MVEKNHQRLSIAEQCKLLKLNRSTYYYSPITESEYNLLLMKVDRSRIYELSIFWFTVDEAPFES